MRSAACILVFGLVCVHAGPASAQSRQPETVRRVVTALDASGKAVAIVDDAVGFDAQPGRNPVADLWLTASAPADLAATDRKKAITGLQPPKSGTIFRIVQFPPMTPAVERQSLDTMMKVVGPDAPAKGRPPRHPMMHRTRTVDYAIVLSGEIDMMLDDSEMHFKAGDVVVQQATNHAWINRGKEPCRIAFVLIDSREP
jgi:mannose-6-phosphate isomerase-like protein (cupin superfamily)